MNILFLVSLLYAKKKYLPSVEFLVLKGRHRACYAAEAALKEVEN
ncbi:hypothetical protein Q0N51_25295 [Priestia megaterium]